MSQAIPSSISDDAQAFLASSHTFVLPTTSPDDVDAWLDHISQTRGGQLAKAGRFDHLPAAWERRELNGVPTYVARPADGLSGPVLLDFHGGGFINGGGELCRLFCLAAADRAQVETWGPDFRRPPLHPYPAGLDDAVAVYRALLDEREARDIFVGPGTFGGGTAGSNLAAALLHRARDEGLPMPGGLLLLAPYLDMTLSGDTIDSRRGLDRTLSREFLTQRSALYAPGEDLAHPYLSPLLGDLQDFPPTLIISGTRDLMQSDAIRMHRKLRRSGVDAELHVWEGMSHGGFGGPGFSGTSPEDQEMTTEIRRFIARIWTESRERRTTDHRAEECLE